MFVNAARPTNGWLCCLEIGFAFHPVTRPSYAGFKQALVGAVDYDSYIDIKDPVVDLVVVMAEQWASEAGWTP